MYTRFAAIVTAAGSSNRFADVQKKEFVDIQGHSVLYRSCLPFVELDNIVALFVTFKQGCKEQTCLALEDIFNRPKVPVFLVEGGETRQESVYNALKELYSLNNRLNVNCVGIHDGARPFVSQQIITDTVLAALKVGGGIPVVNVVDTLVKTDSDGLISENIVRDSVFAVQTPQTFLFPQIYEAHEKARACNETQFTDDAQIFFRFGGKVLTVKGDNNNIKITFAKDVR